LGTAERVRIAPVPAGSTTTTLPVAGTPAYLAIEHVAFRRFGAGPDLLLIGGEDMSMAQWDPAFLRLLAAHFTVVLFDLPGTGFSSGTGNATLQSWADDTAGLILALGLTKPEVLGWGLGGDVALELAETHPSFLASLVLVDTPAGAPYGAPTPAPIEKSLQSRWLSEAGLASIWFTPAHPAARADWLAGQAEVLPDALTERARLEQFAVAASVQRSDALWSNLGSVNVPTLVLFGGADPIVPPSNARVLADGISGARTLGFTHGDYAAIFENEPAVASAVESLAG